MSMVREIVIQRAREWAIKNVKGFSTQAGTKAGEGMCAMLADFAVDEVERYKRSVTIDEGRSEEEEQSKVYMDL